MRRWHFGSLGLCVLFCGCDDTTRTESSASSLAICEPVEAGACPGTVPSFTNDVLPILNRECNSTCHAPGMGQWPLIDYSDVSAWSSLIDLDVTDCAMPPADAGVLSSSEKATVLGWIACQSPNN